MTSVVVLAAWLGAALPATERCEDLAGELQSNLDNAKMAMEPESALGAIYSRATEARDRCADNEPLAYLRLRAAELGRGASVGRQPASSIDEWRALARTLAAKFPKSARIATVQARASGALADARHATELDPSYAPGQVALAAALLSTNPAEAAAGLASVKKLSAVSDGYTVLARVRFALHDLAGAAKAATLALHGREVDLIEPDGRDPRPLSGAHEILGLVSLEKRDYRKAAVHLQSAAPDSAKARAILDNPPPALRQVLPHSGRARRPPARDH
jgi:hypothetical protein